MSRNLRDGDIAPMSPEHRRTLRQMHQRVTIPGRAFCRADAQDWPCDVEAAVSAAEVAEAAVERVRSVLTRPENVGRSHVLTEDVLAAVDGPRLDAASDTR